MKIYAISDLHLSQSKDKSMDIFGEQWVNHRLKIEKNWKEIITEKDVVLIPGDISWAMTLEQAMPDLEWLGELPGKKVILKGNHDFWWDSVSKLKNILPKSIYPIQNNALLFNGVAITGTRLWEDPETRFHENIEWVSRESLGLPPEKPNVYDNEKIFQRELSRLHLSLESIPSKAKEIITIFHYPPTDFSFKSTRTTFMMQKYGVSKCVYGHLHSLKINSLPEFPVRKWGIDFHLASCDFINFKPILVM